MANAYPAVQSNYQGIGGSTQVTPSSVLVQNNGGASGPATLLNFVNGSNTAVTTSVSGNVATVTINAAGSSEMPGVNVTGTSQAMTEGTAYMANNASPVSLTLPTTAAFGTTLQVNGFGAGGWVIEQNSGQSINFGNKSTTVGTGGSISSTNQYDSITLFCAVANTTWVAIASQGNLTVV